MDSHNSNGTHTTKGWVPHLEMVTGAGQAFLAPVKCIMRVVKYLDARTGAFGGAKTSWEPEVRAGELVFALPGGGEVTDAALPPQGRVG